MRSSAVQEYRERKTEMLRAKEDLTRDKCERCGRALKVIVVIVIKLSHVAVFHERTVIRIIWRLVPVYII